MPEIHTTGKVGKNDHKQDKIPVEIWDFQKKSDGLAHGEEGHNGWRCGQCAQEGKGNVVQVTEHAVDYWQTKQLDWQEQCDMIQVRFDEEVAAHFPDHRAVGCRTCPMTQPMPEKPNPPYERALEKTE